MGGECEEVEEHSYRSASLEEGRFQEADELCPFSESFYLQMQFSSL